MGCSCSLQGNLFEQTEFIYRTKDKSNDKFKKHLKQIYDHLQNIDNKSFKTKAEKKKEEGHAFIESRSFNVIAAESLAYLQSNEQGGIGTEGNPEKDQCNALSSIALAIDGSDEVCKNVLRYPGLLPALLSKMDQIVLSLKTSQETSQKTSQKTSQETSQKTSQETPEQKSELQTVLHACIGIVHYIAVYLASLKMRVVDSDDRRSYAATMVDSFTGQDLRQPAISILKKYTELDDKHIRAISALACLVSGSEGESKEENREANEIVSQEEIQEWSHGESHRENRGENEIESQGESQEPFSSADIRTLLEHLGKALDDNSHQSDGCSAVAIELGVMNLLHTCSKKTVDLIKENWKDLVRGLEQAKSDEEAKACFMSLWLLHFDEKVVKDMAKDETLVNQLGKKTVLQDDRRAKALKKSLERLRKPEEESHSPKHPEPYVMISYNHKHKALVKRIWSYLKDEGIETWMDENDIQDEPKFRRSMAYGVENSAAVLICMSQSYCDSENCEDEANYARDLKKPVIPVKVEKGYNPRSWLGFVVAGLFYYDFTKEELFDQKCKELLKAVQGAINKSPQKAEKQKRGYSGAGHSSEKPGTLKKDEEEAVAVEVEPAAFRDYGKRQSEAKEAVAIQAAPAALRDNGKRQPEAKEAVATEVHVAPAALRDNGKRQSEAKEAVATEVHVAPAALHDNGKRQSEALQQSGDIAKPSTGAHCNDEEHPGEAMGPTEGLEGDVHIREGTGQNGEAERISETSKGSPDEEAPAAKKTGEDDGCRGPTTREASAEGNDVKEPVVLTDSSVQPDFTDPCTTRRHSPEQMETTPETSKPDVKNGQLVRSSSVPDRRSSSSDSVMESRQDTTVVASPQRNTQKKDRRQKSKLKTSTLATRQNLISRLEHFGLKHKDLATMNEHDLRFLLSLKYKAPEFYYRALGKGMMMSAAMEVSQFSDAMRICSNTPLASGRSMTIVHCTF